MLLGIQRLLDQLKILLKKRLEIFIVPQIISHDQKAHLYLQYP